MERKIALENRLELLGKLTATFVHEIRNPLSSLKLSLDYLQLSEKEFPQDLKESVNACYRAAMRIQHLIDNLNQITAKSGSKKTDINSVTLSALDILYNLSLRNGINISKELGAGIPAINFEPDKMLQVFLNLITNSMEACETNGNITIRTGIDESRNIFWEVSDNGIGINEDDKEKIFQEFFTNKVNGTGLGLSICKSIIEESKSRLLFDSEYGKGSKFYILFNSNLICEE
jgi:signal transduction histidine kinase